MPATTSTSAILLDALPAGDPQALLDSGLSTRAPARRGIALTDRVLRLAAITGCGDTSPSEA